MQLLSDDDVSIRNMSEAELDAAWDLWFDLASATDAFDPPYTHGVFIGLAAATPSPSRLATRRPATGPARADPRQRLSRAGLEW